MEHKWRDEMMRADFVVAAGDRPLTITALVDGTAVEQPETLFAIPGYFVREFFRLAEENERLKEEASAFRWLKENMPCPDGEPGVIVGTLTAHVHHMQMLLNPRRWSREMCDAWHLALPDLQRAFEGLAATHVTPPALEGEEPAGTSSPAPRD